MKKNIITLAIIATIATTAISVQAEKFERNRPTTAQVASSLIQGFDTDNSTALNELELSGAITYLRYARPIASRNQVSSNLPHPPKIAVELVDNFDTDNDIQLTEEELSEAIDYLRQRMKDNRDSFGNAG